mmetsp:Transcript_77624/g.157992  ORF Transcript_77624/g.157992 Transcript_77624/m.157992 type:complete len:380 (-) Transcript_77624:245-1384(-)
MRPIYDIRLKNTFLEFRPVDVSNGQCFRKTLSCPCLLFGVTPKSEAVERTDSSEFLPEVASTVSTDSDVPIAVKGESQKGVEEKCQTAPLESGRKPGKALQDVRSDPRKNCISKAVLAMQMQVNKQLMEANHCSKPDIFTLVRTQIHRMNAVNLSTAMHRIARLGDPQGQKGWSTLGALLNAIEKRTWQELENHDGAMPARCATIIAWSCAKLQVFRPDLFATLIQVVGLGLGTCKEFEVTNLLWACAQLVKHLPTKVGIAPSGVGECLAEQVGQALGALMDAVEVYFRARLQNMTGQILVSALVSVATLSSLEALSLAMLFGSICNTLLLKSSELSFNNKTQVGVACQIMSRHNEQVVQAVSMSCSETCPELAIYFRV